MAMALANNGVNVQALLDAREALKGAPGRRHSRGGPPASGRTAPTARPTSRASSASARSSRTRPRRRSKPTIRRSSRPRTRASRPSNTSSSASPAALRPASPRWPESWHAAELGGVAARRRDGHPRHPRHGQRCPQRLRRHQGDLQDRRGRSASKEIEAIVAQSQKRSAVYDVITNPVNVTVEVA